MFSRTKSILLLNNPNTKLKHVLKKRTCCTKKPPPPNLTGWWCTVHRGPTEPINILTKAFECDENDKKLNLMARTFRRHGEPFVFRAVTMAEDNVLKKYKEYTEHNGSQSYCRNSAKLIFGNSQMLSEKRNATFQSISVTGGLRIGAVFFKRFFPGNKLIYMPTPALGNHVAIFKKSGIDVKKYRYYDYRTNKVDVNGMLEDIKKMQPKSMILLHAGAHFPTGADLKLCVWHEMANLLKEMRIFPVFILAYQGCVSGNPYKDAKVVQMFELTGHELAVAQTFTKNMGLYGDRPGTFTIVTNNKLYAKKILSQTKRIISPMYYYPPIHGSYIVNEILTSNDLRFMWLDELQDIMDRIKLMRNMLSNKLSQHGSPKDWEFLNKHTGMYSCTGLNLQQIEKLRKSFSVYMTNDGCMSFGDVNEGDVEYLANAFHEVTKSEFKPICKREPSLCKSCKICTSKSHKKVSSKRSKSARKVCSQTCKPKFKKKPCSETSKSPRKACSKTSTSKSDKKPCSKKSKSARKVCPKTCASKSYSKQCSKTSESTEKLRPKIRTSDPSDEPYPKYDIRHSIKLRKPKLCILKKTSKKRNHKDPYSKRS